MTIYHRDLTENTKITLNKIMEKVLAWRKEARDRKDFAMSDAIRDDLAEVGILLEDTKDGTKWSLK
jgi:cysteinyl-tRNA synthetase